MISGSGRGDSPGQAGPLQGIYSAPGLATCLLRLGAPARLPRQLSRSGFRLSSEAATAGSARERPTHAGDGLTADIGGEARVSPSAPAAPLL